MSLSIPSHFDLGVDLGLDISGIPTSYNIGISALPKINLGIDPLHIQVDPLEIRPLDLSFRIKEVPSLRVHFPAHYKVCLALLGIELASVQLCGEGQVITEPYVPNPCECRGMRQGALVAPSDNVELAAAPN